MRLLYLVALVGIAGRLPADASDSVNWRFWNAGDGMVESFVSSVTASPDGALTIRHGAVETMEILDGYRMTGMADPHWLGRIYRDRDGALYGFDAKGIRIHKGGAWDTVPVPAFSDFALFGQFQNFRSFLYSTDEGMEVRHRIALVASAAGSVLVMFPDRIEEWKPGAGGSWSGEAIRTASQTSIGEFIDIEADAEEGIWVAAERGVGRLSHAGGEWHWREWANARGLSRFTYPAITADGSVVATAHGSGPQGSGGKNLVVEFRDGRWETLYSGQQNAVRAWPGDSARIWIKDGERLLILSDGKTSQAGRQPENSGLISDVLPRTRGVFWISTAQGLARYAPALWRSPEGAPSIPETVNSIAEDARGAVWLTSGRRVFRYAEGQWRTLNLPDRQDTVATESLCPLGDGRIVLGTDNPDRLWLIDSKTFSFLQVRHPEGRKFGWTQGRDRNSIWVQTRREGEKTSRIEVFDGENFTPFPGLDNIPILDIRGVVKARDGSIWVGGVEGLMVLRGSKLTRVERQQGLTENDAFSIFETKSGSILIGHRDAVTEYSGGRFRTVHGGMNRARSFMETADGAVWIASGSGVHRWKPDAWITNSIQEGLPSPAAYKVFQDSTGRIWAGTTLGLSVFHPDADREPPVTMISEDRNVHQVSSGGNARFTFQGRDRWKFTSDERLLYSWRLDGGAWSPLSEASFAPLNSVPAGQHLFEVRAVDRNGNSDPKPAAYSFSVVLPWYRESGFLAIAGLAMISLFGATRFGVKYHSNLRFQSRHDPLTGLANRLAFDESLELALTRARRKVAGVALLLLDLDGFKKINDLYGHQSGDALLSRVARQIGNCLGQDAVRARLGGDEFGILLASGEARQDGAATAQLLLESVRSIVEVGNRPVQLSASIGVSLFPDHADTASALLRQADVAMYRSKARNKDCYMFFDPETQRVNFGASEMAGKLRWALAQDGFQLMFQPIVARNGAAVLLEALVRIRDPRAGLIPPEQFIEVAEETNLICDLGLWVLENSCRHLRGWRDAGLRVAVAVNVSPVQLEGDGFADKVLAVVAANGLEPSSIRIEVTERTLIRNRERALAVLRQLRGAGIGIALDDFGVGYSTLEALNTLPVDFIKIDRSLVEAITSNEGMRDVAREIILAAHNLGVSVVAEGIEDVRQFTLLCELNCDLFQGYLFSMPLEAEEAARFVRSEPSELRASV